MHINSFDRYQTASSPIHHLDPRVKVVITLSFMVITVFLPDGAWGAFGALWLFELLVTLLSHLPWNYALKRSFIVLPFTLVAITVIFTLPGRPLLSWQLLGQEVSITDAGTLRFLSILIRSWLSIQMAILLTATTQFPDLMHALHHLRVPSIMVAIISFMYRYLFVMADEALRLLRARQSRQAALPGQKSGGTVFWRAKNAGNMVGQLMLRSLERSDRVYHAMLARGYNGQLLTLNPHQMRPKDWLLGLLGFLFLTFILAIGYG